MDIGQILNYSRFVIELNLRFYFKKFFFYRNEKTQCFCAKETSLSNLQINFACELAKLKLKYFEIPHGRFNWLCALNCRTVEVKELDNVLQPPPPPGVNQFNKEINNKVKKNIKD